MLVITNILHTLYTLLLPTRTGYMVSVGMKLSKSCRLQTLKALDIDWRTTTWRKNALTKAEIFGICFLYFNFFENIAEKEVEVGGGTVKQSWNY